MAAVSIVFFLGQYIPLQDLVCRSADHDVPEVRLRDFPERLCGGLGDQGGIGEAGACTLFGHQAKGDEVGEADDMVGEV